MGISVCDDYERGKKMSEEDYEEPADQTSLILILAFFIYPECFSMRGYKISELSYVNDIKVLAANTSEVSKESLVVSFREQVLKDDASLKSYGIRSGDTLIVTRSLTDDNPPEPKKLTESEIQTLIEAYNGYKQDPRSKAVFEKLANYYFLKKLVDTVPGLDADVSGVALIKNPRLFIQMGDKDVIKRTIEYHPCVAEAAWNFMAIVEEERLNDEMIHDDFMIENEVGETPQFPDLPTGTMNLSGQLRNESDVMATQVVVALDSAFGGSSNSRSPPAPVMPSMSSRAPIFHPLSRDHDFVTPEMFNESVKRAYAKMTARSKEGAQSSSSSYSLLEEPLELSREQLSHQMSQMQELGLVDEAVNLKVLRITGGDVQGAVDLIFGGIWLGDEDLEEELERMQELE